MLNILTFVPVMPKFSSFLTIMPKKFNFSIVMPNFKFFQKY
jgi:hypothetical protein